MRREQLWVVDGLLRKWQLRLVVKQEMEYGRRVRAAEAGLAVQMRLDSGAAVEKTTVAWQPDGSFADRKLVADQLAAAPAFVDTEQRPVCHLAVKVADMKVPAQYVDVKSEVPMASRR